MGTSAFDSLWDGPTHPKPADALDALWDHPATDAAAKLHAEYASGALAKRMARENANDADAAAVPGDGMSNSTLGAFGRSLAATGANLAQGIPGMEAVEAGARSLVRGQSYRDALSDIRGQTSKIPTPLRVTEKMAGAIPLAAWLPGNAVTAGALVGGADEAASADPDESIKTRALKTALGAGAGAALGGVADAAITGVKSLVTPKTSSLLLQKMADRAASAKTLYDAALAEGKSHEATPAIRAFLEDPDIAEIVGGLQQTSKYAGKAADSPEMLDAIYKTLSDQAKQAQKGLDAVNPSKPNIGRFRLNDVKAKQQALLRALSAPGQKPPLTMDVPASVVETEPNIIPGREPMTGPITSRPLAETTTAPSDPTLRQALRDFPQSSLPPRMHGPGGPAFQLRAQPDQLVSPGVRIETPAMRVQTAPAQYQPAMMPTYERAVDDYAQRSAEIDAIKKGYDALRTARSGNLPTANNLVRKTPEAFAEWAAKATPEELAAARKGILGAAKMASHGSLNPIKGFGLFPALSTANKASSLLQSAKVPSQAYVELLQNLGLLTAGSQGTSP